MKLIKYLVWILLLMGSLVFLVQLNEINQFDGNTLTIRIPFLVDLPQYENGFNVWIVLVMTLTAGVIIGFILYALMVFVLNQNANVAETRSILIAAVVLIYMIVFGHKLPTSINKNLF